MCTLILGLLYYTLANFEPKYRAMLKAIQLIAMITNQLLKQYGFECVLRPFIEDMNKLSKVCA